MKTIHIHLAISAEDYRHYYTGRAQVVHATSVDGQRVQFPANRLRPFLSHNGIEGIFTLELDETNRLLDIKRVG